MSLIKNKKAALKFSFLILGLIAIVAIIAFAGGVFADPDSPTIDGVISSGEWDGATTINVASSMGTVSVMADTDYLYVLFDLVDSTDARTSYSGEVGNDQIGLNINPTDGGSWGFPYDIIFETSALSGGTYLPNDGGPHQLPWNPKINSGTSSDNWATRWFPNDAQQDLPSDLDSETIYSGGKRITEWKMPLSSISSPICELSIGGAVDVGDGNSYVYPIGLDWSDASTFEQISLLDNEGPETSNVLVDPWFNNGVFNLTAIATDECSAIKTATYYFGKTGSPTCDITLGGATGTIYPQDGNFDLDKLQEMLEELDFGYNEDGLNWVCIQSEDSEDNIGNCECISYQSDTYEPEEPINVQINGVVDPDELLVCGDDPTLTAEIWDTQSPIQGGEYFLNQEIPPYPDEWDGDWMDVIENWEEDQWHKGIIQAIIDLDNDKAVEGTNYIKLRGKDDKENWGKMLDYYISFIKDTEKPKTDKDIIFAEGKSVQCGITTINGKTLTDGCYYVKSGTTIELEAFDFNPDDSENGGYNNNVGEYADEVVIHWKVWWSYDGGSWTVDQQGTSDPNEPVVITLDEDSYHLIEYWATDGCSNEEDHHFELDIVDETAPETTKEIIGPQYYDVSEEKLYIDGITAIKLTCEDPLPHPVNDVTIKYRYYLDGKLITDGIPDGWLEYKIPIVFQEESEHLLEYFCSDALNNKEIVHSETYYVDHTKPITTKEYGTPLVEEPTGGYPKWITSDTEITLTAEDPDTTQMACNSGVEETKYRITLVNDVNCYETCSADGSGDFLTYSSPFTIPEDSCHLIEYYSVDKVDKTEITKRQCVFVDNSAPETNKILEDPKVPADGQYELGWEIPIEHTIVDKFWYITQYTFINLNCEDALPHPVGGEKIYYTYYNDGELVQDWVLYEGPFQYEEDTYHELFYYCEDALGNKGPIHYELDIVDTLAPELIKEVGDPQYDCLNNDDNCDLYVTQETPITFTCTDIGPHPVNDVTIFVEAYWSEDGGETYTTSPIHTWEENNNEFTLYNHEDSYHKFVYWCEDALGNRGDTQIEWDNVDTTPPQIIVHNPTPEEAKNVTRCTQSIVIEAWDAKSGVNDSSIYAELINDSQVVVEHIHLTKAVYGTYRGLMGKEHPVGWYTLKICASDNLGNQYCKEIREYLPEMVNVDFIDPSVCIIDPETGGTCDFAFNLCMRDGNSLQFWMNKLGIGGITPDEMNALVSSDLPDEAFVGLKHPESQYTNKQDCENAPSFVGEYVWEGSICYWQSNAEILSLEVEPVCHINGKDVFNLHLEIGSEAAGEIGTGVHDLEYWIKTSVLPEPCGVVA